MTQPKMTPQESEIRISELEHLVMRHALALSEANKANDSLTAEVIKLKAENKISP